MGDLVEGMEDAAECGRIAPLSKEELQYLFDLFTAPYRFVGVEPGHEVVLSYDGAPIKMMRTAIDVHRVQALQVYEKLLGADTLELGHVDYSYKQVKPIVGHGTDRSGASIDGDAPTAFLWCHAESGIIYTTGRPISKSLGIIGHGKD